MSNKNNQPKVNAETKEMNLESNVLDFNAKLNEMTMEQILAVNPNLQEELNEAIKSQVEESAKDSDHEEILAAKSEEIRVLEERIVELEAALESSEKTSKVMKDNGVIMDAKKLDPKKKYTTGKNGIGYVEVKAGK